MSKTFLYLSYDSIDLLYKFCRRIETNFIIITDCNKTLIDETISKSKCKFNYEVIGFETFCQKHKTLSNAGLVYLKNSKIYSSKFVKDMSFPFIRHEYEIITKLMLHGFERIFIYSYMGLNEITYKYSLCNLVESKGPKDRIFLIGNGPSLNKIDMSKLSKETTFCCNASYLGFEKWGFSPTYWAFGDRLQVERYYDEYEANLPNEIIKFFPFEYLPILNFENSCPFNLQWNFKPDEKQPNFSTSANVIYLGHSMIYIMLQLACIIGYKEIILVGVDNNYDLAQPSLWSKVKSRLMEIKDSKPKTWNASQSKSPTHFVDKYTSNNKQFIPPRPIEANKAHEYAASFCKQIGVSVKNATPDTNLECYEKVTFSDLF